MAGGRTGVLATYGYDAQGRLDRVDRGNGVATSYAYDGSNRLTALGHDVADTADDVALSLTYGAAGEILTRALDNSAYAAPLPAAGDVTGVADALNRLSSVGGVAINHDAAGRVTADGVATYGYDEAGRLMSVTPAGGGAAVGLSYDVLGRLSRVAVAGQAAVNLAYDGLDVVAELDDAGTILRRYAHGAGVDNVLATYDGAGTGNRRWLLADERGSVIAGTDGAGAVSGINAYDEYGVPAPGNSGLFQYTGQVRIPGTGLYHYKARAYHPGLGRFLQPDPMGYADGVNLYAYVGNDPINLVDPLGLESEAIQEIIQTGTRDRPQINWLNSMISDIYGNSPVFQDSGRGRSEPEKLEEIVVTAGRKKKDNCAYKNSSGGGCVYRRDENGKLVFDEEYNRKACVSYVKFMVSNKKISNITALPGTIPVANAFLGNSVKGISNLNVRLGGPIPAIFLGTPALVTLAFDNVSGPEGCQK